MKKLILSGALLLCFSATMFGGPCLPGTLADYITLGAGGCDLGVVTFANFTTATGFFDPIDPLLVGVTPGGSSFAPEFLFTLNSTAGADEVFQSFFSFDAVHPALVAATIGLVSPTATGDGAVTGILDICANGTFAGNEPTGCSGAQQTAVVFAVEGDALLSDSRNFAASSFFDIFVDLTIDGGLSGTATLPSATVSVNAVPEPAVGFLVAAGLVVIGAARARRRV